ncbi:alkaline phosphatase family protein [Microbacterium invictum]|uniref:AlkP superfamily pyrophosphatase or phosphodiesterase n=1 Tax=Microbacterium invictum TaxID=515415 RepID=A0AA40VLS3_9MICO|nr:MULTISPECIES: nucleotide pyrophosphatase/phosphodiesterase family protein [Microbacterium]MBB4139127.1 putative AlkP superfamily pyrophosphatase or phosphodiesterase [Microbacterium invictum]
MPLSLPADPPSARSLTGVLPQILAAIDGHGDWFPTVRSAIVVMVDGLGRGNLTARSGHARFLNSRMGKRDAARSVFPATTATALASLFTGVAAGSHGIVGYRARVPGTDSAPNQLKGWETDGLDPMTWQRAQPLFEREAARGRPCIVVSKARYTSTGFTRALQRGATFLPGDSIADRVQRATEAATRHDGAIVYLYVPELDTIGHAAGWESAAWTAGLEQVDDAVRRLEAAVPDDVGVVVTADHGMVDVPAHRHVLLSEGDELVDGIRIVAGEPRMLHLYAEDGAAGAALARWQEAESGRSWVLSREEAIAAGLFGSAVSPDVAPRIGDILVAARSGIAYYDDRLSDKKAQKMIGQHGSLTDQERIVPLIRLGAFATTH